MNSHVIYRAYGKVRQYFAGEYTGELRNGKVDVSFKWTTNKQEATTMLTTDAWDLLFMCRKEWENMRFEVERV